MSLFLHLSELCCYEDGRALQWTRKWETISGGIWEDSEMNLNILAPYTAMPNTSRLSNCPIVFFLGSFGIIKSYHLGHCVWAHRYTCCSYRSYRDKHLKRCVFVPRIQPSMHVEMSCNLFVNSELHGLVSDLMLNSTWILIHSPCILLSLSLSLI